MMTDNKAIILDGDGTLWRPIGSDGNSRPDTVYGDRGTDKNNYSKLALVEGAAELLLSARNKGYKIFVVSAHPTPGDGALQELKAKIDNLGLSSSIDGFYCSDGRDRDGKSEIIRKIVADYNLNPTQVHMAGDSYYYDYEAGIKAGVRSYFIKNNYCKQPEALPAAVITIDTVGELAGYLG